MYPRLFLIDLQKLGQLSVSTTFWMEMFFPPIALWQNMMPLQLLKETCSSFWGTKGLVSTFRMRKNGWHFAIQRVGELHSTMVVSRDFLPAQVTIPMSPEFTFVLQQCQVVQLKTKPADFTGGRIGMMGTIFTDVNDYPPEVLQNGWLEDYFPIGKVPFQERTVKLRECNFYGKYISPINGSFPPGVGMIGEFSS